MSVTSSNPCDYSLLTPEQKAMVVTQEKWEGMSAKQQQFFMNITADAAHLGVPIGTLQVDSISIAGETLGPDGKRFATQSELVLTGNTGDLSKFLQGSSSGFDSWSRNVLVGWPHKGYSANYRQSSDTWSMQINLNLRGSEIDIDPYNPAVGLIGGLAHLFLQAIPNFVTRGDTNPFSARTALLGSGVKLGDPCTGH